MIGTLIFIGIGLLHGSLTTNEEWKKEKEKNGITVYTRKSDVSNIKEFRAEGNIQGSMHALKHVFLDVDNYCEWVSDCRNTEALETGNDMIIYHMELSVPFPFENRDMVQRSEIEWSEQAMTVTLTNEPTLVPEKKGCIRLPLAEGFWRFEKINEGEIKATLQYVSDPAGRIPAWLVNMFIVDGPINNIENLREMVQLDRYQ
jgi:hypothetical protein